MFRGSCLCGTIRYEAGALIAAYYCHCGRCRKWSGSAFSASVRVPLESLTVLSGDADLGRYPSAPLIERCFCRKCGSNLFTLRRDRGFAHLRMGALDGEGLPKPRFHAFVASKADWFEICDELPQHDGSSLP